MSYCSTSLTIAARIVAACACSSAFMLALLKLLRLVACSFVSLGEPPPFFLSSSSSNLSKASVVCPFFLSTLAHDSLTDFLARNCHERAALMEIVSFLCLAIMPLRPDANASIAAESAMVVVGRRG